ncbi:MAG: protein translocase subunit SecF [Alphaproteobacteria bacterium]|nr:protein translocase subunit SecF [Alphaproteobacteria bacterium]
MTVLSSFRSYLSHTKIDFMKPHKLALALSVVGIVGSLLLVAIKGLNFGIDFAGGILIEAQIDEELDLARVRELLSAEVKDVQIQNVDQKNLLIRVAKADEEQSTVVKKIQEILGKNFSKIEYQKIDYVGPQVGSELIMKGFMALLLSFVFIMIYIWVRFDWQFGVGGIFALVHDAVLTLGFYSLTGLEFNLTSIAAILTIIGYSINDSVVIYDRIRENMRRYKKMDFAELINSSANSTLSRTILTSGVTLISILALILFGGKVLYSFSVATFFGIVIGTYSSIYISAPILIYFDPRKKNID